MSTNFFVIKDVRVSFQNVFSVARNVESNAVSAWISRQISEQIARRCLHAGRA